MKKLFFTSAFLALLLGIWAVNPNVAYANSSYATLSTINSFSSEALAATSTVSGSCGINGSNVSWSLNTETGVLTISGSGEMANYQSENEQPWYSYSSSIKSVVVRSGVTSIGDYAFRVCKNLTSISMPLNLTSIGKSAIAWCNLTPSLIIPYGVKTIGKDAFSGNENLTSVTIPSTVTQIDNYAFYKCSNITSVDISNVETWCNVVMGNEFSNPLAWAVSMNYKSLYVNGVLMENLVIPDGISSIRELAFYCCSSLKTVTIPQSVTSIGNSAFDYCKNLKAIKYCGTEEEWQNVTLGSWTGISASILYYSDYCGPNAHWSFDNGTLKVIGSGEMTSSPWQFFTDINNILTVDIEDGITSILGRAFSDCGSLTTVNIPNSVTTIGDYAFIGSGLQSVTFEGNPKVYKAAFNIASLKNVYSYGTDPQMGYDDRDEDDEYYIFKYSGKLHVLKGLKAKYSNTLPWRRFSSIVDDLVLPATNITIDKTSLVLQQNESQVLSFAITPEDATVKTVTWSSSDTSVATVDETGLVTAIAPGSAIITVSTTDGSDLSATCEVTVEETSVPVSNITLNITSSLLTIGETTSLTATISPDDATNKSVTWSSSNTEVATVDDDGVVTAVAVGTAIITVTAADGSGVSATCSITVTPAIIDGDANSDNEVDVSDVALTVEYILGHSPNNFVFAAADLDKDNTIDVADVAMMVNIIMYGRVSSPISASKALAGTEYAPYLYVTSGGQTLNLWLANADNLVSAMQFDLALPQGVELRDVLPSSFMTQHSVSSSLMDNGMTRVLCISLNNSLLSPDEHGIMAVSLSENIEQLRDLYLKNIIISTPDGAKKHLKDVAVASTTDMKLLTVGQQGKDIYSLNGQKRQSVQKGLNIIKTSDGSYKKIMITKNK